jgi:peptidoglycan/xylan/chitin deacetylase (PgdA/CDA1 family)
MIFLMNCCSQENIDDAYKCDNKLKSFELSNISISNPIIVGQPMSISGSIPNADLVKAKVDIWEIGSSAIDQGSFEINYTFTSTGVGRKLTLTAYNEGEIVDEVTQFIDVLSEAPALTITWDDPVFISTPVTFSGTANGAKTVDIFVDTWLIGSIAVAYNNYSFSYNFNTAGTNRNLVAKAKNESGQIIAEISKPITVSQTPDNFQLPTLVLMYHEVTHNPTYSSDVSVTNFEEQMQWLKNNGYQTVSTADLLNGNLPNKSVVITFDDGYIGNFLHAKPILEALNMKADFFIHTGYVGAPGSHMHMTWQQLQKLSYSSLFEVYSHTVNHPHLTSLNNNDLNNELFSSKITIENQLDRNCPFLAYPFGDYNGNVIQKVIDNGYQIAYAVEDKGTFYYPRQYSIPRVGIGKSITTIQQFIQRITN